MRHPARPSSTPLASHSFIEVPNFEPDTVASIAKRRVLKSSVIRRPHTTLEQYSREWKWKDTKLEDEDEEEKEEEEMKSSWVDSVERSILQNSRDIKKIQEAYTSTRSFRCCSSLLIPSMPVDLVPIHLCAVTPANILIYLYAHLSLS